MNWEQQLKLQAYLDGELSGQEADQVKDLLNRDEQAQDLAKELTFTKTALCDHEPAGELPESREFFWSKIERQISREETANLSEPQPVMGKWLIRFFFPLGAAACLVALSFYFTPPEAIVLDHAETTLDMPGGFTFYYPEEDMTVVWVGSEVN